MREPADAEAREHMLLGAHLAGAAIENSMLGAAHACANPLTATFGIVHGVAVGLMLPHVVRYNAAADGNPYAIISVDAQALAQRIQAMLDAGGIPRRLAELGVAAADIPALAAGAAQQWTASFNPRSMNEAAFHQLYERAL